MSDDIIQNWVKLIDSVSNEEELDCFLSEVSGETLDSWKKKHKCYLEEIQKITFESSWKNYQMRSNLSNEIHWIDLYKPICNPLLEDLEDAVDQFDFIQDKIEFFKSIENYVFSTCMNISYRTVVVEINSLRISKRLIGSDKFDRYQYFLKELITDEDYLVAFYQKYPVLFELLTEKTIQICTYTKEILFNISNDYGQIVQQFNLDKIDLQKIKFSEGDTHNKGKTVCSLILGNRQLIYKPRTMEIDIALSSFSEDFYKCFGHKILFVPKTLTLNNHSYVEFIVPRECHTVDEVKDFYTNMGKLLAVLYLLGSRDFHGENIIFSGGIPYLIDNETILHTQEQMTNKDCFSEVMSFISESVYSIGILPTALYSENSGKAMEVGALNSGKERVSPFATHQLTNSGTDEIKVERVFKEVKSVPSTVFYKGNPVSCGRYITQVHKGFEIIYSLIMMNKNELFQMIRKYFGNVNVRHIYKNTNSYVQVLETSYHPELLQNKIDRDIYFIRLYDLIDRRNNEQKKLLQSEIKQLKHQDIPIFYSKSSENNIFDSRENQLNVGGYNVLDDIQHRLSRFSGKDLLRQQRIINMAFVGSGFQLLTNIKNRHLSSLNSEESIRKLISNRLLESSFEKNGQRSWLSMLGLPQGAYHIMPMDYSLYNGTGGVILSLLENADARVIKEILQYVESYINTIDTYSTNLGAFDGLFGYFYLLVILSREGILSKQTITEKIYQFITRITFDRMYESKDLDIISGLSGILAVLLTVEEACSENSKLFKLCKRLSSDIVKYFITLYKNEGLWIPGDMGYSHGNYGIILQLFRYSLHTKQQEIEEKINFVINDFLKLERTNKLNQGTYLLRGNSKPYSWCNGLVGILQAKYYLWKNGYKDSYLLEEIMLLCSEIDSLDVSVDQSICHGSIGNLVIVHNIKEFSQRDFELRLNVETRKYLENRLFNEMDDWGLLAGESGILMSNSNKGRSLLTDILLLC